MSWHADADLVARYVRDELTGANAASLELHLMACAACRGMVAVRSDTTRLAATWREIEDRVDRPRLAVVERFLVRLGVRDHLARLVVLTPSLRTPWLTAVAALLLASVLFTRNSVGSDREFFFFLVIAPLLPLVGVGAAFGSRTDPAHELAVAAPIAAIELLLVRAVAVLVTCSLFTAIASVAVPGSDWSAAAWLLPSLGLTTATLALTRWIPAVWAAGALGGLWLLAATALLVERSPGAELVSTFVFFQPSGQLAFGALTLAAAAVIATQRHTFDFRSTT